MATSLRKTERQIEILKSAVAAFRRRGYHGASMGEIAQALGMTKGNLYYYFKNKEEILFFCHDYSLDILLERLREALADTSAPDVRLRRLVVAFVHMIIDDLHGTALTMDFEALSRPHRKVVVAKRDRFDHGLRRIIADGIARGVFKPGDPKLYTFAILGAANWITRWYDPRGRSGSEEIAAVFADYLVGGLLKPRRAANTTR